MLCVTVTSLASIGNAGTNGGNLGACEGSRDSGAERPLTSENFAKM